MVDYAPLWFQREAANTQALAAAWDEHRLSVVMATALDSFNRLGNVDAHVAADALGVSPRTVQRWIGAGVPHHRVPDVVALVRPPQGAFAQEALDLINARIAVRTIAEQPQTATSLWGHLGWLERHDLAIIQLNNAPVQTVRIAATERGSVLLRKKQAGRTLTPEERDALRRFTAGGDVIDIATFPNRPAATVARSELLEDVYPDRLRLPDRRLARGGSKAWLAEAPHKPLSSYRRRARERSRPTTIPKA